ncbi:hypothetical protein HDV03_003318 [Kappamyces sp. JEL0829]|nr:hypothetical protein HDV03_003318 [Kappamyces sp. JEL0829]KAJ3360191.1 hypothetical protein HDU91_004680 [Kappamyces sp. JEL0680]
MARSTYINMQPSPALSKKENRKISHSIIERKRREKMNVCLSQLCKLVPSCVGEEESLQKLTILERTVDYIMALQGMPLDAREGLYTPPSPTLSHEEPCCDLLSRSNPMAIANLLC